MFGRGFRGLVIEDKGDGRPPRHGVVNDYVIESFIIYLNMGVPTVDFVEMHAKIE